MLLCTWCYVRRVKHIIAPCEARDLMVNSFALDEVEDVPGIDEAEGEEDRLTQAPNRR